MYNDILTIGSFTIHGYGLMIGLGVLFAFWMAVKRAKKRDFDVDMIFNIGIQALVYGLLGAKLLYIVTEFGEFLQNPWSALSGGGFVVYGGILVGVLAAMLYCRKKEISFLEYFDLLVPSVALAQGFGRLGCFLAGCCYGCKTDSWFSIIFTHSDFAPNNVSLFPSQLVMSAGDFLIVLALLWFAKKPRKLGSVGGLYLVLYSVGRFVIEFFRSDDRGSLIGPFSQAQFISLFMLAGGILLMTLKFKPRLSKSAKKAKKKADAAAQKKAETPEQPAPVDTLPKDAEPLSEGQSETAEAAKPDVVEEPKSENSKQDE